MKVGSFLRKKEKKDKKKDRKMIGKMDKETQLRMEDVNV